MKVLIWIIVIFIFALIDNFLKYNGISLGAIPTTLWYGGSLALAGYLCKRYSEHKEFKTMMENRERENNTAEGLSEDIENLQVEEKGVNDPQYGLVAECPVFIKGEGSKKTYLDCLCTKDSETLSFCYKRSIKVLEISGLVQEYDAYRIDDSLYGTIYLSIHGTKDSAKAPAGYKLSARYDKNSDSKAVLKHSVSANETENKKKVAFEDITISNLTESDSNNDWIAIMDVYTSSCRSHCGDDFHFADRALGQRLHADAGFGRFFGEIPGVDLVEGGEIVDVRQKAEGLHRVFRLAAGGGKNGRQIFHDLLGLFFNGFSHQFSRGGIKGDLPGGIHQPVDNDCL